jgi:hypothetical protein
VYMWLVPDTEAATGEVHLMIQQQIQNLVSVTDDMSLPIEWFLWARWALASDLATGQPQAIMDRCANFAEGYRKLLEDWDVEDAGTFFTPDRRMVAKTGAFR